MYKTPVPFPHELEIVTPEQLVPKYHLLRLIDCRISVGFIHERTAHLYCAQNGHRHSPGPAQKETKVNLVDLDAGHMVCDGKPIGFFYLGLLDRVRERFDFYIGRTRFRVLHVAHLQRLGRTRHLW